MRKPRCADAPWPAGAGPASEAAIAPGAHGRARPFKAADGTAPLRFAVRGPTGCLAAHGLTAARTARRPKPSASKAARQGMEKSSGSQTILTADTNCDRLDPDTPAGVWLEESPYRTKTVSRGGRPPRRPAQPAQTAGRRPAPTGPTIWSGTAGSSPDRSAVQWHPDARSGIRGRPPDTSPCQTPPHGIYSRRRRQELGPRPRTPYL